MQRRLAVILLFTGLLFALRDSSGAQALPGPVNASDLETHFLLIQGRVTVGKKNQPGTEFTAVKPGAPLQTGDEIRTGPAGEARLLLDGRSIIDLGPDSDLTLESLTFQQSILHLEIGTLVAKIKRRLDTQQMQFNTVDGVVLIRGTEFAIVRDVSDGPTRIGVFSEGHLDIRTSAGEIHMGPREETEILKGASSNPPARPMKYLLKLRQKMRSVRLQLFKIQGKSRIRKAQLLGAPPTSP